MGRPTRAAPPRRQERLLRPWPPSLPREAGGAVGGKGLCGLGGGGSICSLGYCLPDGSCPPSPGPGDTGWRLLRRVYKPESASTPLCHYTRTRLLFMEKSVRTRPPRGDRDYCVPGPRQHTPHSCARGWTFKTFPLTPPGAAPVARLASLGDAEPRCHPFLRTFRFFWDTVCGVWLSIRDTQDAPGQPCLPTLGAEVGVCVCVSAPCSSSSSSSGSFYPLHATKDPGLTRLQDYKRMPIAYLGSQLPERGSSTAVNSPLCAWRLGRVGDPWQRRRLFPLAPGLRVC